MATWNQLKSKRDYKSALERVDALLDIKRTDAQQNEFLLLSYLIEEYEELHFPIPDVSPQEVIRWIMEMKGIKQVDLIPILGTKGYVSKIVNGTASVPLESIGDLSAFLGIPADALIPKSRMSSESINMVADRVVKYRKGSQK